MHIRPLPPSTRDARAGTETFIEVFGFGSNPGNLRMLSYVPEGLPAGAPLVVVLHGCTQTAIGYALGSGWLMLAEEMGFALLLPEQRRANNHNGCFNWFKPDDIERDRGEARSIRQMIDHMVADHGLDQSRIFATGLSAGGAMAAVMLATYPEVFAGGAILAGLPYKCASTAIQALACMRRARSLPPAEWGDLVRQASPHRGPWPRVSIWHGTRDRVVALESSLELVKQWTDVHEVAHMAPVEDVVDGHARWTYRDATGIAASRRWQSPNWTTAFRSTRRAAAGRPTSSWKPTSIPPTTSPSSGTWPRCGRWCPPSQWHPLRGSWSPGWSRNPSPSWWKRLYQTSRPVRLSPPRRRRCNRSAVSPSWTGCARGLALGSTRLDADKRPSLGVDRRAATRHGRSKERGKQPRPSRRQDPGLCTVARTRNRVFR